RRRKQRLVDNALCAGGRSCEGKQQEQKQLRTHPRSLPLRRPMRQRSLARLLFVQLCALQRKLHLALLVLEVVLSVGLDVLHGVDLALLVALELGTSEDLAHVVLGLLSELLEGRVQLLGRVERRRQLLDRLARLGATYR